MDGGGLRVDPVCVRLVPTRPGLLSAARPVGLPAPDNPPHLTPSPRSWVPVEEKQHMLRPPRMAPPPEAQLRVCDYLYVPRRQT